MNDLILNIRELKIALKWFVESSMVNNSCEKDNSNQSSKKTLWLDCEYITRVNLYTLEIGFEDTLKVTFTDEKEDEYFLFNIDIETAKYLIKNKLMVFNDVSWFDSDIYFYCINVKKVLDFNEDE
jgi:hypothetical protein